MDTAYSYGEQRLTNERFNDWTGYYTYDPRGSVSGVTDADGMIWQSYRYDVFGDITFAKPQFNNVYGYNAESYNPNIDMQYLRARYYNPGTAAFMTEDSYLGELADPLTLNRYNYVSSSPLNYIDPSGHSAAAVLDVGMGLAGTISNLDGPVPGYADVAGAIVAGGTFLYAGGVYVTEQISQASKARKTKRCETDAKEEKSKGKKTKGKGKTGEKGKVGTGSKQKKPKKGTGKEKADDVPSWAKGNRPYEDENGKEFAERLCDEHYGKGNYSTKGQSDYSKIRKWGDRGFE